MVEVAHDQASSNWVDPDVVAYYESTGESMPSFDPVREAVFKRFFSEEWQLPEFDDLRERWDPLIIDEDPHGRLYGKTALWSVVQLRRLSSNNQGEPSNG